MNAIFCVGFHNFKIMYPFCGPTCILRTCNFPGEQVRIFPLFLTYPGVWHHFSQDCQRPF